MDGIGQNTSRTPCRGCGTVADAGQIFCVKCGAVLRSPSSLMPSNSKEEVTMPPPSLAKRFLVTAIKALAGLSAIVLLLCPLRSGTQWLVFAASIAVLVTCHFVLTSIDE